MKAPRVRRMNWPTPAISTCTISPATSAISNWRPTAAQGCWCNRSSTARPRRVAGVKVGDRLLEAGVDKTDAAGEAGRLGQGARRRRSRGKLSLVIDREGAANAHRHARRRPLEVIRPEAENVLMRTARSLRGSRPRRRSCSRCSQVDDQEIKEDAESCRASTCTKRTGESYRPRTATKTDTVTFERRVPKYGLVVTKRYKLSKATTDEAAEDNRLPDAPAATTSRWK